MQPTHRSLRFAALVVLAALPAPAFSQGLTAEGRAFIVSQLGGYGDDVTFVDFDGDGRRDVIRGGDDGGASYVRASVLDGNSVLRPVYDESELAIVIPTGMTAADLDGDGTREILYSSVYGHVYVLESNGQGGFQHRGGVNASVPHGQLATGDIDGDGDLDVLVVGNLFRVLENQGGTLVPGATTSIGSAAFDLAVGDLDGDGDLDVVVPEPAANSVGFLWNTGGAFTHAAVPLAGEPSSVELADVDQDGDLDVLVGRRTAASVALFLNQGVGSFAAPVSFATGPGCARIDVGDLDSDGDPDIAVVNGAATEAVSILRNLGGGAFAPFVRHGAGNYGALGLVDLDLDGDLDIALVGGQALWNRGDATLHLPLATAYNGSFHQVIRAADLDGDGDEDLAISGAGGDLYTRRNVGGGVFVAGSTSPMNFSNGAGLVLADLDGDGDLDAVCSGVSGVYRCINPGNATFGPAATVSTSGGYELRAGDLDGDGAIDLVGFTSTSCVFARNQGSGTFDPFVPLAGITHSGTYGAALGDLDGDGDLDLVVWSLTGVRLYENLGGLAFAPPVAIGPAGAGSSPVAADLDQDSDLDLISMSPTGPVVQWNLGAWNFSAQSSLGGSTGALVLDDLDGDGDFDVLTHTAGWTRNAVVHENLGGGAFSAPTSFGAGGASGNLGIAAVDTDADGDQDFVCIGVTQLFVLENHATSGAEFCLGDGSATACPCGNASIPSLRAGCVNSSGRAGALRARGSTSLASDGLVLAGAGMSNSMALYFQGTSAQNNGLGTTFGDGLRCAGGSVTRLAVVLNVLGTSELPGTSGVPLRVLGNVTAPGERTYQVWYRDAAAFCTPSTFNLTNGVRVSWRL